MKCLKKIEIPNVANRVKEIANKAAETVDFIAYSNWWKKRKELGKTEAEMEEIVNKLLGNMISEKINYMILHEIIMNYGSKKMIDAYNKYRKESFKALESGVKNLESKNNENSNRKNTKKV